MENRKPMTPDELYRASRSFKADRKETDALRALLEKERIEYVTEDDGECRLQTRFVMGSTAASVICDYWSYGGREGLLECRCYNDRKDVMGFMSAKEVIEYVTEVEEGKKRGGKV